MYPARLQAWRALRHCTGSILVSACCHAFSIPCIVTLLFDQNTSRLFSQIWTSMDDEHFCAWCGWTPEFPDCHVQHSPFCPSVRAQYDIWVDEDGEMRWRRRRDFLWVIPRLLAWSRRAVMRVEQAYAPTGVLGQEIINEWSSLSALTNTSESPNA
jgi:hypothetical protein